MDKKRSKLGLTFKIVLGLTIAYLVIFVVLFFLFGAAAAKTTDADIQGGIGDVIKYHFSDMGGLFSFKFHNASNVIYLSLSAILYFFIFIAILYLIIGILFVIRKHKPVIFTGIVASLIAVFIFMLIATGMPKYWTIINKRNPFENNKTLVGFTYGLLLFGAFYIITAHILYFVSLFAALKAPKPVEESDEEIAEEEESPVEEKPDETVSEIPSETESESASETEEEAVLFEEVDPSEISGSVIGETTTASESEKPVSSEDSKEDLKELLKEVVRDIVRDEIARNNANQARAKNTQNSNAQPVTGATFGGPLVVQYFNGGFASNAGEPVKKEAPQKVEEPPKEPEPKPAPVAEEKSVEEKVEPIVEPAPATPAASEEKKPIIRIPFTTRMIEADKEMQVNYNELKNEILSYGVNSRVSNSGDTFRLHRKTYIKITIAGLSLKLYFALNPEDYKDSTLPIQDAGHKGIYAEIPLVFKVKSGLSMRRCKQLIQDVFDKNGLEQGEIGNTDWVEELKNAPSDDSDED